MPTHAIIFANGDPASFTLHNWEAHRQPDSLLIGADGGTRHFATFGVVPHLVLGDFDSLSSAHLIALEAAGVAVERHSPHKDQTDLELAIEAAVARGATDIVIFGALSNSRWDMTLANMLLIARPHYRHVRIRLIDTYQDLMLIQPGQAYSIPGKIGATISLIPLAGDATGVTTTGVAYPLTHDRLPFGATLGISNVLTSQPATVSIDTGQLICVIFHRPPP